MSELEEILLYDPDGDWIQIRPVHSFEVPMLSLFVSQEGEESGVNLTAAQAIDLANWLLRWSASVPPSPVDNEEEGVSND